MDSKKVIEKLLKIATQQQKIIQKLAQAQQGLPPDSLPNSQFTIGDPKPQQTNPPPPPTPMPINAPKHMSPGDAVKAKLAPQHAGTIALLRVKGGNPFAVEYVTKGKFDPKTQNALEDAIAAAVNAAQRDGAPGVPKGQFSIAKVNG